MWPMPHRDGRHATTRVPCSNAANIGECKTWTQSEFSPGKIPLGGKSRRKNIYSVPAHQETAKHGTKFGWPLLNDVAAVTEPMRETRWNLLGCLKPANRSQPLMGRSSAYYEGHMEEILLFNKLFSDCRYLP